MMYSLFTSIQRYTTSSRLWTAVVLLGILIFLSLRLPGIDLPYHQDEWKNVTASETVEGAGTFFAHPPLMQMVFVVAHEIFGTDYFRIFPIVFATASALLLYLVMRRRAGWAAALWSVFLYAICFSAILGSLVPDVDGAILPFLFILAVYAYDRFCEISVASRMEIRGEVSIKAGRKWLAVLIAVLLVGFLIKLSFILVIGTLLADYVWSRRHDLTVKKSAIWILNGILFGVVYVAILYLISAVYPAFDMSIMLGHANQFREETGRSWMQIAVQSLKSVMYLSPLLLVPLLFVSRQILTKTRVFGVYLVLGLLFYLIIFDFSRGALDKYLMFSILPLAAMIGCVFAEIFKKWFITPVVIGLVLSIGLIALNFLPHEVLPLYPKSLWFEKVLNGEWLMLNPFNGGSGPLGFYVSFLFIAASFIVSGVIAIIGFFSEKRRASAMIILLVIGIAYNADFAEELLFGRINGSAPVALAQSVAFIGSDSEITQVITYNDIGAGPLSLMGKYGGRFYAAPQFEEGHKERFAGHQASGGHFLVVGIPPLGLDTFYGRFFAQCDSLFFTVSGNVRADIYECKK